MVRPCTAQDCYAEWRCPGRYLLRLQESIAGPSEHMLQVIWQHQRIQRNQLHTTDDRALVVLHPGFWNYEAGPDFRGAVIQFADSRPAAGDVEIDLTTAGWHGHQHDRNPEFKGVILHVVWEGQTNSALPTLALKGFLDSPLEELSVWIDTEGGQLIPAQLQGQCCQPLRDLPPAALQDLLQQAALIRLESKARQIQARARQVGWDQALWEGLFRGLGYKHNVWPMQRLAELRDQLGQQGQDVTVLQAVLLGTAGLLPEQIHPHPARVARYIRRLWDCWWREREAFCPVLIPKEAWRFHGLRPANHPARRLALAAHWISQRDLIHRIEQWGLSDGTPPRQAQALLELLQPPPDAFWAWHWTFRSAHFAKPKPLIGQMRITDLAVNAILPWLWMRAGDGRNPDLQQRLERLYLGWPRGEDNAVLRLARQRLLGTTRPRILPCAAAQQGLLQIVRDFCAYANSLCQTCRFPGCVMSWCGQ
jgi:hypothetical protein